MLWERITTSEDYCDKRDPWTSSKRGRVVGDPLATSCSSLMMRGEFGPKKKKRHVTRGKQVLAYILSWGSVKAKELSWCCETDASSTPAQEGRNGSELGRNLESVFPLLNLSLSPPVRLGGLYHIELRKPVLLFRSFGEGTQQFKKIKYWDCFLWKLLNFILKHMSLSLSRQ